MRKKVGQRAQHLLKTMIHINASPLKDIMNKYSMTPVVLAIAMLVGACSSLPTSTTLLDQTRSDYVRAQNNPKTETFAPLEMKQAGTALAAANASSEQRDDKEKVDRLAYLAKQKIALAEEAAKQRSAEADVANAGKERDQLRLDQRTKEADQAKSSAEQARLAAQIAQNQTLAAQHQTQDAERMAMEEKARADAAEKKLEMQLADLAAKKTERGIIITLGDVLFGTDQSRLTPAGLETIQKLAAILQQNPQRNVLIEGFTDSTGSNAYNQGLSERRAAAVRSALQLQNVARERITMRGYGESYPVAGNANADDRQLNRRVEIVLSDLNGKIIAR